MKSFEFVFTGDPVENGAAMNAGIRLLRGEALEIANCLGMYAAQKLKAGEPSSAIIVVNAFKKFMELNPDLTAEMSKALMFNDGAQIIRPTPDQMGNINPFKAIKN